MDSKTLVPTLSPGQTTGAFKIKGKYNRIEVTEATGGVSLYEGSLKLNRHSMNNGIITVQPNGITTLINVETESHCPKPGTAKLLFVNTVADGTASVTRDGAPIFTDVPFLGSDSGNFPLYDSMLTITLSNGFVVGEYSYDPNSGEDTILILMGSEEHSIMLLQNTASGEKCDDYQENFSAARFAARGDWHQIAHIGGPSPVTGPYNATWRYNYLVSGLDVMIDYFPADGTEGVQLSGVSTPQCGSPSPAFMFLAIENQGQLPILSIVHRTNYSDYAIVGSSDRSFLIILCKEPQMNERVYNNILKRVAAWGYPLSAVALNNNTIC